MSDEPNPEAVRPRTVQLFWRHPADPTRTVVYAQANLPDPETAQVWARRAMHRRLHECPPGWEPGIRVLDPDDGDPSLTIEGLANPNVGGDPGRRPVQLHWQNRADPQETRLVAESTVERGEAGVKAALDWVKEMALLHHGSCPAGWGPLMRLRR